MASRSDFGRHHRSVQDADTTDFTLQSIVTCLVGADPHGMLVGGNRRFRPARVVGPNFDPAAVPETAPPLRVRVISSDDRFLGDVRHQLRHRGYPLGRCGRMFGEHEDVEAMGIGFRSLQA